MGLIMPIYLRGAEQNRGPHYYHHHQSLDERGAADRHPLLAPHLTQKESERIEGLVWAHLGIQSRSESQFRSLLVGANHNDNDTIIIIFANGRPSIGAAVERATRLIKRTDKTHLGISSIVICPSPFAVLSPSSVVVVCFADARSLSI